MIIYKKLDVTSVEKGIIAHGVNGQFVMGSGVALAIRNKWPIVYDEYAKFRHSNYTGGLLGQVAFATINENLIVANCFTQMFFGNNVNVKYANPLAVETSLNRCVRECNSRGLDLYMPRIGCGLGGLSWVDDVLPIVEKVSGKLHDKLFITVCDL